MRRLLLALGTASFFALSARAQDAALVQAQAAAGRLAADSRARGGLGLRGRPDDDAGSEPQEVLGNFRIVEPGFYRSAQPTRAGYGRLKALGVRTILNLQIRAEDERELAKPYGIDVVHVAMAGLWTPTFAQMDRALEVLRTAPRPLLVHCTHGQDRTGFVVASYRVAVERMSIPTAVAEAREAGCCFVMFEDLAEFLEKYNEHRRAHNLDVPAAPSTM